MRWLTQLGWQTPITGRRIKEDGSYVNIADLLVEKLGDETPDDTEAVIFSTGNGITLRDVTSSSLPILSIRVKSTDKTIIPIGTDIFAAGNSLYEVYINATLTGASWVSADSSSDVEYDVSATAVTGGTKIASGFVVSSGSESSLLAKEEIMGRLGLEYNNVTNVGDILTIKLTPFAGTVPSLATVQWRESDLT